MCLQAIKNVIEDIEGPTENQFFKDIQTLVPVTFQDQHVKSNPAFQLFVPSFLQPFYDQGGKGG
jgi:hypothetical protein